jgi:hypothetical protein
LQQVTALSQEVAAVSAGEVENACFFKNQQPKRLIKCRFAAFFSIAIFSVVSFVSPPTLVKCSVNFELAVTLL